MYLPNKYTAWYNRIIARARCRKINGYSENHHIIPKSLGGGATKENLVSLTAREHFICHLLLTKMTTGRDRSKMVYAFHLMLHMSSSNQRRHNVSSKLYTRLREERSIRLSVDRSGSKNPMFGKTITEEHRQKLREAAKNKPKPSRSTVERRNRSNTGQKRSEESRMKMSEAWKHKSKATCQYCGITCAPHLHNRWHGVNCRQR